MGRINNRHASFMNKIPKFEEFRNDYKFQHHVFIDINFNDFLLK